MATPETTPVAIPAPIEAPVIVEPTETAAFDAAFDELTLATPAATPEPTPTPAPTAAPAATPEPTAAPTVAPAVTPEPTAAPTAAPDAPELQAQLAELTAKYEALKTTAQAAPEPTPPPTPAPTAAPMYNADEQAALQKYRTDWSEVAAGEALVRRAEYGEVVKFIFSQLGPQIEALRTSASTTATRSQYADLKTMVPDYDEVRDSTIEWIAKQPAYLRNAYTEAGNSGTPEEVADMITRFKKDTGYVSKPAAAPAAAPAPTAAPVTAAGVKGGPRAAGEFAAAAVAALKPVATGRTSPSSEPDNNDYDGAFKEFAGAK